MSTINQAAVGNLMNSYGTSQGSLLSYLFNSAGSFLDNGLAGNGWNFLQAFGDPRGEKIFNSKLNGGQSITGYDAGLGAVAGFAGGLLDKSAAHLRTSGKYGYVGQAVDTVADAVGMVGNYNPLATGLGRLGMGAVNKITGGTDGMTIQDSLLGSGAVSGTLAGIAAASATNPVGWAALGTYVLASGINAATGKTTTDNAYKSFMDKDKLTDVASGYTDMDLENEALNLYNKKYGGFSMGAYKKALKKIDEALMRMTDKIDIRDTAKLGQIRAGMVDANNLRYLMSINGGYKPLSIGRKGLKINPERIAEAKRIAKCIKLKKHNVAFTNVIPEEAREAMRDVTKVPNDAVPFFQGGGKNGITLEEFIDQKIQERTKAAIKKATTRKTGYKFKNKSWKNCIATATDNYGVPIVLRNADLVADPKKYGFEELLFGDNLDTLPDGVLILDYNKPNNYTVPGHTIMLVGRTEKGAPIYSYSSGSSDPEDMHNSTTNYFFDKWDDKVKPRAYRYIGTPAERAAWEEEYRAMYPEVESYKQGGQMNVIPEGSLHARLHHMEDSEHITKKGIPVVDMEGRQQAEIERNEIIFRKEVTNKLEELAKDGSDEAAIEAGKLLAVEIIENTEDRTGLIGEVTGEPKLNHEVIPSAKLGATLGGIFKEGTTKEDIMGIVQKGINVFKSGKEAKKKEQESQDKLNLKNLENSLKVSESFAELNRNIMNNGPAEVATTENGYVATTKPLPEVTKPEISNTTDKSLLDLVAEYIKNNELKTDNAPTSNSISNLAALIQGALDLYKTKKKADETKDGDAPTEVPSVATPTLTGEDPTLSAQKGEKLPEFNTFFDLKNYLNETGRGSDEDYDLEAAYNDPEVYGYWREEEEKNPGKGHWSDKYKKDSHITYSVESVLGDNPKQNGGRWVNADGKDIFIVSPYLENKHSLWDYLDYFVNNEPDVSFRYKGVTYSTGRKKK